MFPAILHSNNLKDTIQPYRGVRLRLRGSTEEWEGSADGSTKARVIDPQNEIRPSTSSPYYLEHIEGRSELLIRPHGGG